jgi:hypothetical protein
MNSSFEFQFELFLRQFFKGIAQGGLITLGKHNKFNYNHQRYPLNSKIFNAYLT